MMAITCGSCKYFLVIACGHKNNSGYKPITSATPKCDYYEFKRPKMEDLKAYYLRVMVPFTDDNGNSHALGDEIVEHSEVVWAYNNKQDCVVRLLRRA
jgi:hypothetical protein